MPTPTLPAASIILRAIVPALAVALGLMPLTHLAAADAAPAVADAPATPVLPAASRVDAVTVYLDRAWVTRLATVELPPGTSTVVLTGLPTELDEASLRLTADRPLRLAGLSTRRAASVADTDQVKAIDAQILAAADQRQEQLDLIAVAEQSQAFVDRCQANFLDLPRAVEVMKQALRSTGTRAGGGMSGAPVGDPDGVLPMPAAAPPAVAGSPANGTDDEAHMLAFLEQSRLSLLARLRTARAAVRTLDAHVAELSAARTAATGTTTKATAEVLVRVDGDAGGKVVLSLSYLLPGALWFPSYDLKSDPARTAGELTLAAVVQQSTGEDWTDSTLTLSAARPASLARPPRLDGWKVDDGIDDRLPLPPVVVRGSEPPAMAAAEAWAYTKRANGAVGGMADRNDDAATTSGSFAWTTVQAASEAESSTYNPANNLAVQYGYRSSYNKAAHARLMANAAQAECVAAALEDRTTSAVLRVPARATVLGDGTAQRVLLSNLKLPLTPTLTAVPLRSPNTIYTVSLMNPVGSDPWLPGEVACWIGGDLLGKTALGFLAGGERADLPLGVDEQVIIRRRLDEKASTRSVGSRSRRLELTWHIDIENHRDGPATVTVIEPLPRVMADGATVRIRTLTPAPTAQDAERATWQLTLPAGGKQTLTVTEAFDLPNGLSVPEIAADEAKLPVR